MEFKVGDIVYSDDPAIIENGEGIHKYHAVIWEIHPTIENYAKLRYPNYAYRGYQYHGSDIKYLRHVPTLIKELL